MSSNYWQRRLSRRSAIRVGAGAGVGLAALSLIGCGGDDKASPGPGTGTGTAPATGTAPSGSTGTPAPGVSLAQQYRDQYSYKKLAELPGQSAGPKQGGTYRFSTYPLVDWDLTGPSGDVLAAYAPNHFNGLVTFPMDDFSNAHNLYKQVGDLAASWEQVDELTLTFKLNPGVKFHDVAPVSGRELVAEDVKYCYDIYKTTVAQGPTFEDVESTTAVDPTTVQLKFGKPAAYFLQALLYPVNLIFAKEAYEDKAGFATTPIGTGPFVLDAYDPATIYSGKRHPEYFKKDAKGIQLPYADGFEAPLTGGNLPIEESAFLDGKIDTIWTHTKSAFDRMLAAFPDNVGQVTTPPPGYLHFITLKLDKPPFDDVRVRQALQHLIDMNQLVNGVAEGLAEPALAHDFSFFGREFPWSQDELVAMGGNYAYDPTTAKQLLSAAGFESGIGRTMTGIYDIGDNLAAETYRAINNMWRQAGIDVAGEEIGVADFARLANAFYGKDWGDMDYVGFENSGPGIDEDQYCFGPLSSKSARNVYWINDPALDDLTEKQRRIFDLEERRGVCTEIIKQELTQSYRIWGIMPYKLGVRRGYSYNIVDTIHAWANLGWGCKSDEVVWFNGQA